MTVQPMYRSSFLPEGNLIPSSSSVFYMKKKIDATPLPLSCVCLSAWRQKHLFSSCFFFFFKHIPRLMGYFNLGSSL